MSHPYREKEIQSKWGFSMSSQINKVSKKEVMDAIDYFWVEGFIEEMKSDQKHYVKILLKKSANDYNIKLDK